MIVVLILVLILAAAAGLLWDVVKIAAWLAFVLFLAGTTIVLAGYGWVRNRLRSHDRSA